MNKFVNCTISNNRYAGHPALRRLRLFDFEHAFFLGHNILVRSALR
jgi:hypothetical protein